MEMSFSYSSIYEVTTHFQNDYPAKTEYWMTRIWPFASKEHKVSQGQHTL